MKLKINNIIPLALVAGIALSASAEAANVTWSSAGNVTAGGNGNWTGGNTWWNGSNAVPWTDSDNATFSAAGNTTVNSNVTAGTLTFESPANVNILAGAGALTLNTGITATNSGNTTALTHTVGANIALGGNVSFTSNNGGTAGTSNLAIGGNITGGANIITKNGNGTLTLSGSSSSVGGFSVYNGSVLLSSGTLSVTTNSSFRMGSSNAPTFTLNGGTLNTDGVAYVGGDITGGRATFTLTSGTWTNTGGFISIQYGSSGNGSVMNVNGGLVDSPVIQLGQNAGTSTLNLNGGIVAVNRLFNTGSTAVLNLNGGTLQAKSTQTNFLGFTGNFSVNVLAGGAIIDTQSFNSTISVPLLSGTAVDGGLTKNGTGTLTLSANNTYTGATTVNAGTLLVNGSLAANSTVTVNSGATLGGNGTINGAAVVNGTLQPGNSPGVLTIGSSLTLGATSAVVMELNSTVRGTGYDGIDVTGALTYGGALTINVGSTFLSSNQTFSLFAGSTSESGNFASVSLAGAYGAGSFTNAGSGVWNRTDSNGNQWSFSQDTGNLGFTAVPEPTTAMLGGLGLLALGLAQVLRRRRA